MRNLFGKNLDLVLVFGVIAILLILFTPIPPFLIDLSIVINFAFALTILLLTFYVGRPVEFSTFPSLLLVATLFRVSLNVAATRLILTSANAGDVIGAIGSFAVQGNFIVGLVVFFILVVVQYVVVTSGAQRVSEVAARFMLDSVPGQQMPEREQTILRQHYVNSISFDQLAALLAISKGRVSQLHRAALSLLRKRLREHGHFRMIR
jgi:flagellar biosynthesis protein FlhA